MADARLQALGVWSILYKNLLFWLQYIYMICIYFDKLLNFVLNSQNHLIIMVVFIDDSEEKGKEQFVLFAVNTI